MGKVFCQREVVPSLIIIILLLFFSACWLHVGFIVLDTREYLRNRFRSKSWLRNSLWSSGFHPASRLNFIVVLFYFVLHFPYGGALQTFTVPPCFAPSLPPFPRLLLLFSCLPFLRSSPGWAALLAARRVCVHPQTYSTSNKVAPLFLLGNLAFLLYCRVRKPINFETNVCKYIY